MLTRQPAPSLTAAGAVTPASPARRAPGPGGTQWLLVLLVVILCLIGVVMVLSASSIVSLQQFGSPWYFFERQLMWLAMGAVGFVVARRVDPERWRRLSRIGMYLTAGLLFAVLVPGIGVRASGASRHTKSARG